MKRILPKVPDRWEVLGWFLGYCVVFTAQVKYLMYKEKHESKRRS